MPKSQTNSLKYCRIIFVIVVLIYKKGTLFRNQEQNTIRTQYYFNLNFELYQGKLAEN